MIRHLFIQLHNKQKRVILTMAILLLSFFAISIFTNFLLVHLVKSFSPIIDIETNNRVELYLDWDKKAKGAKLIQYQKLLKQKVLELNEVEHAGFIMNDLLSGRVYRAYDSYQNNSYPIFCGEDFNHVFNLNLKTGNWFTNKSPQGTLTPMVITSQHATELGITEITKHSIFKGHTFIPMRGKPDSVQYQIVGIVDGIGNMRTESGMKKIIYPVFIPSSSENEVLGKYYADRLILKVKPGSNIERMKDDVNAIIEKLGFHKEMYGIRLVSVH
jgi:hypothetical protein